MKRNCVCYVDGVLTVHYSLVAVFSRHPVPEFWNMSSSRHSTDCKAAQYQCLLLTLVSGDNTNGPILRMISLYTLFFICQLV